MVPVRTDPKGCAAPREFTIEITPKDNGEVISSGPCNVGSVLGVCAPPFLSKNTATHFLCEMLRFALLMMKTCRLCRNQNLRHALYCENSSSPRRRLNHFPRGSFSSMRHAREDPTCAGSARPCARAGSNSFFAKCSSALFYTRKSRRLAPVILNSIRLADDFFP